MKIKKIIYLPKKCTLLYQIIEDFNYVWKMEDSQTLIMVSILVDYQTKNRILLEILLEDLTF